MSTFTLAISYLTTSNLPWFMDLTFQVPMQYCSLQHWPCFYHQSHPQLGIVLLWLHPFILSGVISPLISCSILGTYWSGEFLFQCPIILPFILFMGISRKEYWNGLPFPSPVDHILSDLSTMTCPSCVAPHSMACLFVQTGCQKMSGIWVKSERYSILSKWLQFSFQVPKGKIKKALVIYFG